MSKLSLKNKQFQLGNSRIAARRVLRLHSHLVENGAPVTIIDLSPNGFLMQTEQALTKGNTVVVQIPNKGPTSATIVWTSQCYFGCEFDVGLGAAAVSASLLKSEPIIPEHAAKSEVPGLLGQGPDETILLDHRYSLRSRALVILGGSIFCWMLVGFGAMQML